MKPVGQRTSSGPQPGWSDAGKAAGCCSLELEQRPQLALDL